MVELFECLANEGIDCFGVERKNNGEGPRMVVDEDFDGVLMRKLGEGGLDEDLFSGLSEQGFLEFHQLAAGDNLK